MWVIRRQIHQAEDLCCDAWVRWIFPDCAGRYAELVLKTAECAGRHAAAARQSVSPLPFAESED